MTDKQEKTDKPTPEPGSPADLLPEPKPGHEPTNDIRDKGEPPGGGNFA